MSENVQTLNYSAHAIEDLKRASQRLKSEDPASCVAWESVIALLRQSVKFLLPNRGELLDLESATQTHLDLLKLPFPCIALEAPWADAREVRDVAGQTQMRSTKRIALCWEAGNGFPNDTGAGDGTYVLPVFWIDELKEWKFSPGALFVPAGVQMVRNPDPNSWAPASRIAWETVPRSNNAWCMNTRPVVIAENDFIGEVMATGSVEGAFAQILANAQDELMMLVQACAVLNCHNVSTAEVPAAPALNKKRVAQGKQPFFSYKVLSVPGDSGGHGDPGGGSHASPRSHLRRGHIRQLEGRAVWVRHTMVGLHSGRGAVGKQYEIKAR